ncbi:MAG: hypothetical protein ACJ8CB_15200 [Ktedonobacteraceae bacterium]
MNTNIEKLAPYAPFGCVIAVIRRLRERGLPETLTMQEITRVGVSEGNASRTLQALTVMDAIQISLVAEGSAVMKRMGLEVGRSQLRL